MLPLSSQIAGQAGRVATLDPTQVPRHAAIALFAEIELDQIPRIKRDRVIGIPIMLRVIRKIPLIFAPDNRLFVIFIRPEDDAEHTLIHDPTQNRPDRNVNVSETKSKRHHFSRTGGLIFVSQLCKFVALKHQS